VATGKFTCPCCGFKTLDEQPPGTFDICPICFWEDDRVQFDDPDFSGGANVPSLRQAQANFQRLGACEERFVKSVRQPTAEDERDAAWRAL
jgi:hypothetical protein